MKSATFKPFTNGAFPKMPYPSFGMLMQERSYSCPAYRFGFNGQEKDDEISGDGNNTTATFWELDSRIGRRWNLDPKPRHYISRYSVLMNNPNKFIDLKGDTPSTWYGAVGYYLFDVTVNSCIRVGSTVVVAIANNYTTIATGSTHDLPFEWGVRQFDPNGNFVNLSDVGHSSDEQCKTLMNSTVDVVALAATTLIPKTEFIQSSSKAQTIYKAATIQADKLVLKSVFGYLTGSENEKSESNQSNHNQNSGILTGDLVNLKTGSSKESPSLGLLNKNEKLIFTGKNENGFVEVKSSSGKLGWVSGQYVKTK